MNILLSVEYRSCHIDAKPCKSKVTYFSKISSKIFRCVCRLCRPCVQRDHQPWSVVHWGSWTKTPYSVTLHADVGLGFCDAMFINIHKDDCRLATVPRAPLPAHSNRWPSRLMSRPQPPPPPCPVSLASSTVVLAVPKNSTMLPTIMQNGTYNKQF